MRATRFPLFGNWDSPEGYLELRCLPCFFAIVPDTDPAQAITYLGATQAAAYGLDWKRVGQRNPHLTLCAIEKFFRVRGPPKVILDAAATVRLEAFDARFDHVETFQGSHATVLRADAETKERVRLLAKSVKEAMYKVGIGVGSLADDKPHVTMFYDPLRRSISGPVSPLCWRVRDFVLVRSHVGYATHEILGRWPLESR